MLILGSNVAGALERAASHKLAFLQILHLLLECPALCDLLEASLAAQVVPMHTHMLCRKNSGFFDRVYQ